MLLCFLAFFLVGALLSFTPNTHTWTSRMCLSIAPNGVCAASDICVSIMNFLLRGDNETRECPSLIVGLAAVRRVLRNYFESNIPNQVPGFRKL